MVNLGRFGPLVATSGLWCWRGHPAGDRWHLSKQGGGRCGDSNACAIKTESKNKIKLTKKKIKKRKINWVTSNYKSIWGNPNLAADTLRAVEAKFIEQTALISTRLLQQALRGFLHVRCAWSWAMTLINLTQNTLKAGCHCTEIV